MKSYSTNNSELNNLVEKYSNLLFNISYSLCRKKEDAEDVVQDVFIKLLQRNPSFISHEHEKAWLIRVTINMSTNYKNTFWQRNRRTLEDHIVSETKETNELWEYVRKLPDKYQIVIDLFYREGFSIKEISFILKKNESSIRTHLERARIKLKQLLTEK